MNDFNKTDQMHFEFDEYQTMQSPDFNSMINHKSSILKAGGFDPHKLMIQKKESETVIADNTPKQLWPDKDINALQEFCAKYGIMGYNCGRMSPIAALAMLKQKLGVFDSPSESRVTYSDSINKKILLNG